MARGRPKAVEHEGRGHVYERELRAVFDDDGRCSLIATRSVTAGGELLLDYCFDTERLLPPQAWRDHLLLVACCCDCEQGVHSRCALMRRLGCH